MAMKSSKGILQMRQEINFYQHSNILIYAPVAIILENFAILRAFMSQYAVFCRWV